MNAIGEKGEAVFARLDFASNEHHLVDFDIIADLSPRAGKEDDINSAFEVFKGAKRHRVPFFGGVVADAGEHTG